MNKKLNHTYEMLLFFGLIFLNVNIALALDEFLSAASEGDNQKLETSIANGAEMKGEKGGDALYRAALHGQYDTAVMLIAHGADVNFRERINGFTPLHAAVTKISDPAKRKEIESIESWKYSSDDIELIRKLRRIDSMAMNPNIAENKLKIAELIIERGADVNASSKGGITPLQKVGTKEMGELLVTHGADVNARSKGGLSLIENVICGNPALAEVLIARGVDVIHVGGNGETLLHRAVSCDEKEIVELLIKKGAKLGTKNRDGYTTLNLAIWNENAEMVKLLLESGEHLDEEPEQGHTELHKAVDSGNRPIVELLLAKGAPINIANKNGITPMHIAVMRNNYDMLELLIERGGDVIWKNRNEYPLTHSIKNKKMMELFLKHGADVNSVDREGNSLLWKVCYDNEMSELLLKYGADINIRNSEGRTVLHLASRYARDNVVKWLIKHGADVNAKDTHLSQTPIFYAVRSFERHSDMAHSLTAMKPVISSASFSGSQKKGAVYIPPATTSSDDLNSVFPTELDTSNSAATVEFLLTYGADVHATDRNGRSILYFASTKDIAELLIARGVAVNSKRTDDGATALHFAAEEGRKDVVQVLLAHGADVNAINKKGDTPLFMAKDNEVVKLLLAHGAVVNTRNGDGKSPLLHFIRSLIVSIPSDTASIEIVKALVLNGADVNDTDSSGMKPLMYIMQIKANPAYSSWLLLLNSLEDLLVAKGAKYEDHKSK